tara:strand:+ start:308 stop:616 length:309 start_codon:yes stop_codon:yes gene_type:complete
MADVRLSGVDASTGQIRVLESGDVPVDSSGVAVGDTNFTPSVANDQTAFTLPTTPTRPDGVVMIINGASYFPPTYFTVSGTSVTWLDLFTLVSTDAVQFKYV